MASLVRHAIGRMASNASSTSSSSRSRKSSSSWGRRRPRDSLEKIRERKDSVPHVSCQPLPQIRNFSVQDSDGTDDDEQTLSLPVLRPPINRNVVCERYPKGKASLLVFLLNVIVIYAYGAAITGIVDIFQKENNEANGKKLPIDNTSLHFIKLLFEYCISRISFPVTGFIADVYIGRWRMIYLSLFLLLTGYVIIAVGFTVEGQSSVDTPLLLKNFINGIGFLFLCVGGGAFEATIIPFGVDQLQGASSAEISSYFYSFYFSRNLGMGSGLVVSAILSYAGNTLIDIQEIPKELEQLYRVVQPLVTTVTLTVGLILMICFHHWFFKNTLWENPVKLIARILCYAATVKRHLPVRNRAFRYGEERKRRIELAKMTYDGKFPDEKVEDVKAFCRILLILLTLTPAMFSINGVSIPYLTMTVTLLPCAV